MSFIPNTTPTPNWLYNGEMKKMSDTELRVVLVITRKTLGWIDKSGNRKDRDWISQKLFMEKTGKSNRSISTAIENCLKNGWIESYNKNGEKLKTPQERSGNRIYYRLGDIFRRKITNETSSQVKKPVNLTTTTSELNDTKPVKIVHTTKETLTKETIQKNAKASFASLDDFINKCKNSPQRHIQIIGEWAEGERPSYNTGAQWDRYLKRNLRAARELTPFSAEELQKAYIRLQGDVVKVDEETGKKVGFLSKYTLETLAKYI